MKRKAKVTPAGAKMFVVPKGTIVQCEQLQKFPTVRMINVTSKSGEPITPSMPLTGEEAGATLLPEVKSSKI